MPLNPYDEMRVALKRKADERQFLTLTELQEPALRADRRKLFAAGLRRGEKVCRIALDTLRVVHLLPQDCAPR